MLVIDAVEISTDGGHYVALDMPPAPYPLGGQADAVVEDVARLGGFGIAAHPGSVKSELAWKAWVAPIDGLEWLSLDSEWRDESRARLAAVASRYLFRRGPAVASLLDRPVDVMGRWDGETARRSVLGIAGHDAHGGPLEGGGGRMASVLGIPSYEAAFRAFGIRAVVSSELTGRASDDAELVVGAIRGGRVFTAVDAVAGPAFVDYRATAGGESATMGETLPFERDARLTVRATVPEGGRLVALRDGREFAESASGELDAAAESPGAYRIEVRAPASPGTPPVPWIVTNPIYLRGQATESGLREQEYSIVTAVQAPAAIEKDPGSTAALSSSGPQVALDYALRSGDRVSQYVAWATPMPKPAAGADALAFDVRSAAPMRLSVQLRFEDLGGKRWTRSVYVSPASRRVVVPFSQLVAVDSGAATPAFGTASSILFVVDLTNAVPGQTGRFEISNLALATLR